MLPASDLLESNPCEKRSKKGKKENIGIGEIVWSPMERFAISFERALRAQVVDPGDSST
jgi:hypothetical protein